MKMSSRSHGFKSVVLVTLLLLFAVSVAPVQAAWEDYFPAPEAIGPGGESSPGPVLSTLTPQLKFNTVGAISYIYLYDAGQPRPTLGEWASGHSNPVLMVQVNATTLQIPAGVLLPGKTYCWYVESTHAPGTKSEATRSSLRLYFSTAKDAK
ncbi:MAG: hypothetical protein P4N59_32215 [Negativicutes bacterium]|nr:hypothetical protein [Negativicutes bacterium]